MKAIEWLTQQLNAWWAYTSWCINAPYSASSCRPFWTYVALAFLLVGAWLVLWVLSKVLKYYLAIRAERRRQEEAARVADEETMKQHAWEGDKAYSDATAGNVEERIRVGLAKMRAQKRSGNSPAGTAGDQNPPIV